MKYTHDFCCVAARRATTQQAVLSNSHFWKLRALSALTGTGSGSKTVAWGDRFAP
jgi:hypothetical protein